MTEYTATVHGSTADLKPGEWNAIVTQQSKSGSVFERYEWLDAYEAASDATPRYVQVRKGGTLVGVHPTYARSVPGTPVRFLGPARPGYNGPMIATDEGTVLPAMFEAIDAARSRRTIGHVFKPASDRVLRYGNALSERGYSPTVRGCQFVIDLDRSWDDIEAALHHDKRRNLRRADDAGVTVQTVDPTEDAIASFARSHERHMERIGGSGTTHAFLDALRERLADRIELFVAECDGENAGQLLTILDDERDRIYLLFPGYDPDGFEFYASEALYRAAIRWGIDNGYAACSFGETEPDWEDGTFRYKAKFGGRIVPSLRWEKIHSRPLRLLYFLGADEFVGSLLSGATRIRGTVDR